MARCPDPEPAFVCLIGLSASFLSESGLSSLRAALSGVLSCLFSGAFVTSVLFGFTGSGSGSFGFTSRFTSGFGGSGGVCGVSIFGGCARRGGSAGLAWGLPPLAMSLSVTLAYIVTTGGSTTVFSRQRKAEPNRNTTINSPCRAADPTKHFFSNRLINVRARCGTKTSQSRSECNGSLHPQTARSGHPCPRECKPPDSGSSDRQTRATVQSAPATCACGRA